MKVKKTLVNVVQDTFLKGNREYTFLVYKNKLYKNNKAEIGKKKIN